jgi:1-acyl-sn-glycerol-3-phosphate acyltransferase
LIQDRCEPSHRSRVIAANNILNALFMVASAGFAIALLKAGASIPQLFLATGLLNAAVAIYIYWLVPEFLMRFLAWLLVHALYRFRVVGLENIPEHGPALLVCNHVSFVDAVVIAAACRRPIRFVMDHAIFNLPLLRFIFRIMNAIPIAPAKIDSQLKERAFAEVSKALAQGELIGIFPEGGITRTGELERFRPGIARILRQTPVPVVPMALSGLWGSIFSRKRGAVVSRALHRGPWARITLAIGAPVAAVDTSVDGLHARVLALRGGSR